ncbi:MAG: bifunctional helix-turn-helix transcriptional regulator/GNAT family N-acetyltransferase [Alistipes sp.]|nr:bifunctional helix-turn-helix transcriptional regulator/GNAT family N-acetyltransferase [Alistipes sp.]
MDFFDKTGKMAIGSRLRMLTDRITTDAAGIYRLYGVDIKPKWFPVLYVLSEGGTKTVTGIAREIGQTHPSVSNLVKEMTACKLVREVADKTDKRRTAITLAPQGKKICDMLTMVCDDVAAAVEEIAAATRHDLWKAIGEWEEQLSQKSLFERVKEVRRERECRDVRIIPYEPCHRSAFRALNEQWITQHWQLEAHDIECLDQPQESIIDKGGDIFVALYKDKPVGVCALCKMDDPAYDYELAKLAVSPDAQGKGIGYLLCKAVVDKARSLGAKKLFLESNTLLKPAIHTYKKLGFRELAEYHPAYARGDIQMELFLDRTDNL